MIIRKWIINSFNLDGNVCKKLKDKLLTYSNYGAFSGDNQLGIQMQLVFLIHKLVDYYLFWALAS